MSGETPDALTELVRILREQLAHKDERIARLDALLSQANDRLADQHQLIARILDRLAESGAAARVAAPSEPPAEPAPVATCELPDVAPEPPKAEADVAADPIAGEVEVAEPHVVSIAEVEEPAEEREITAKFDREHLSKGHRGLRATRRKIWPFGAK